MNIVFQIAEAPRVYVEKISINGNVRTKDQVIRREFRLSEGDAFNTLKVKRSRDRLQSLGFFQDKLEVEQKPGSAPDKVILETNVQEKSTGSLEVSAGYSSLENFILSASISQRDFRGRGQELRLSGNISSYSKSISAGFTEPYLFGRNLALGVDVFRKDYNAFNSIAGDSRNTTYSDTTTGFQVRTGFAITEFWAASIRYGLSRESVTLDPNTYYSPNPTTGVLQCDPLLAGRYLCDAVGAYTTSSVRLQPDLQQRQQSQPAQPRPAVHLQPGPCRRRDGGQVPADEGELRLLPAAVRRPIVGSSSTSAARRAISSAMAGRGCG